MTKMMMRVEGNDLRNLDSIDPGCSRGKLNERFYFYRGVSATTKIE